MHGLQHTEQSSTARAAPVHHVRLAHKAVQVLCPCRGSAVNSGATLMSMEAQLRRATERSTAAEHKSIELQVRLWCCKPTA